MSRKWERMVRKNTKIMNKKHGQSSSSSISVRSSDGAVTFKGRSWLLPLVLVAMSVFCFIALRPQAGQDESMYWVTGFSYLFLALLMYWARRPFLRIGKTSLASRRFGGDRIVEASQISEITVSKDTIMVTLKPKGKRWVFTKFFHQMPMEAMIEKISDFASKNNVKLIK
ncbi:hypothetical protein P9314_20130 [Paenibacillus validus]|uniref:Methyltransferase n=1 Tax=Paenibacillus validus TaxID=44253 RepID=A0A7X3CS33_9BACL|nr:MULTISPECIES: hypothetical protein [Paenibacillus]MED4602947.1 hypothetical protein [Paenibacillus validus]MED4608452.1 hypothetical protein [Paenibacillus validus]MUG69579.1 hypothetical protein [Paenibacillus validus]